MSEFAIRVEGLSKQYEIGEQQASYKTLRDSFAQQFQFNGVRSLFRRTNGRVKGSNGHGKFWALKDVSFEVKPGEVVGIIGRNGAGKSTLLKVLSRITEPTTGYADIKGRIGSLLEVGTGFHPELTGRENVFLNGAILGMRRAEIQSRFDEIVAFAEVEKFIDTPVKHYSSGMYLRLAFAVAAHLDPEILLFDEVLAVGDTRFQNKCLGKMGEVAKEGRTVLFVSHNLSAVQTLCSKGILLANGEVASSGTADEVISDYLCNALQIGEVHFDKDTIRDGNGLARLTHARLLSDCGELVSSVAMGEGLTIELEFECKEIIKTPAFAVRLMTHLNQSLIAWRSYETQGQLSPVSKGGRVRLRVDRLNLLPGNYHLVLNISDGIQCFDLVEEGLAFEITPRAVYPTGKIPSSNSAVMFTSCTWEEDYS